MKLKKLNSLFNNAAVAQLVELLICNQVVGGSNPLGGSIYNNCWGVAELADAPSCFDGGDYVKAHLGGSNPSPPAIYIGAWCNGNTTGFDPVILGSSPSAPSTQ